jgi:hypothetical protein
MRALLVTYHFPPDGEIGAVRPYQLARHLPAFGIETWVLTVEPAFAESPNAGLVAHGVPEERIIRSSVATTRYESAKGLWRAAKRLGRSNRGVHATTTSGITDRSGNSKRGEWVRQVLGFLDARAGWYESAVRAGEAVLSAQRFDAIVSTSPPRVASKVAATLARRRRLPWVMDLRDPWWGSYSRALARDNGIPLLGTVHDRRFRSFVRQADIVVHNTDRLRQLTCRLVPELAAKARFVPNGIDSRWHVARDGQRVPVFRIGHYGQIYGRRSASGFLVGLHSWLSSLQPNPPEVEVDFTGSGFEQLCDQARSLGLEGVVRTRPSFPREAVPALMAEEFVLLLLANAQPLQVPGKTYEYLAAGRRILALTDHDGATADFLKAMPGCYVAQGPTEVHAALELLQAEHQAGAEAWVDRGTVLAELDYARSVERFAELLREAAQGTAVGRW